MRQKLDLKEMQRRAEERGGKCLSSTYVSANHHLEWECKNQHRWFAKPSRKWCLICSGSAKRTIEEMHNLAAKFGGLCLSDVYPNNRTKLKWQCKNNHEFEATSSSVGNYGYWCSKCYGNAPLSIEEMHKLAESRNGKCLSKKYKNVRSKLKWQCNEGHSWTAAPFTIRAGKWCPECASFKTEKLCREVFSKLFGCSFKKSRPKWLTGFRGWTLELDGFNKKLKLAFEYNGEQHYKNVPYYHTDSKKLKYTQEKDKLKLELCEKKKIKLIVIQSIKNSTPEKVMKEVIKELDLQLPNWKLLIK